MNYLKIISIFLIGLGLGLVFYYFPSSSFSKLSPDEMHQQVISQRDFAIKEAIARGEYNCCIEPACTMCYMEANQWNNQKAGTCDCVDLIIKGEEPCPQCKRELAKQAEAVCDFSQECEEDKNN